MTRYKQYSAALKEKYGEKVYRIPLNLPLTCPNRDGACGRGGCTFCADVGAGFESLPNTLSVAQQLEQNIAYIAPRYKANKFIAYFQNYSNTYLPFAQFQSVIREAVRDDVVEIAISTRPDCVTAEQLAFLDAFRREHNINITMEFGLQSVNPRTLAKIRRGHGLAEFIAAVQAGKQYGFGVVAHLIVNLPYDEREDVIEAAKILSALGIDGVKLHSLYLIRGTQMAQDYLEGRFTICSKEEYVQRVVDFLSYCDPEIEIQRLVSRAPKEESLFCNYGCSWWVLRDAIEEAMEAQDVWQGSRFDYLIPKRPMY